MSRKANIALLVLAGLATLVLLGVALVSMVFDADKARAYLQTAAQEATGRELRLEGDVQLTYFPWLGLEVTGASLADAEGFGPEPMMRLRRGKASLRLSALLSRRLEISTVRLEGLTLRLTTAPDGTSNWQDLLQREVSATNATSPLPSRKRARLADLVVGGLELVDTAVLWTNQSTGQNATLTAFDLTMGALRSGASMGVDGKGQLQANLPDVHGALAFSGQLTPDWPQRLYGVRDLKVSLTPAPDQQTTTKPVVLTIPQGRLDWAKGLVDLPEFALSAAEAKLSGAIRSQNLATNATWSGAFRLAPCNPRQVLQSLGQKAPATADPTALTRLAGNFEVRGSPQDMLLENLVLELDDSHLTGQVRLAPLSPATWQATLELDRLHVDRYLPGESSGGSGKGQTKAEPEAEAAPDAASPHAPLRALKATVDLRVGQVQVRKLHLTNLVTTITAQDGVLTAAPLEVDLYQGHMSSQLRVDVRGAIPEYREQAKLTNLRVGPVVAALMGNERLDGTANLTATMASAGTSLPALQRNLAGSGRLEIRNGVVRNLNLPTMLRDGLDTLKGRKSAGGPSGTTFDRVSFSFRGNKGQFRSNDLVLVSPLLQVTGQATANLPADSLDGQLMATVVGKDPGADLVTLADLLNIPVPVRISGSLSDPKFSLDSGALAGAVAKGAIKAPARALKGLFDVGKDGLDGLGNMLFR